MSTTKPCSICQRPTNCPFDDCNISHNCIDRISCKRHTSNNVRGKKK